MILQGRDSELLDVLKGNGFNSTFFLKNIDFNCPEGSRLFSQLNYGQQCLLKGLVDIANHDQDSKVTPLNSYTTGAFKQSSRIKKRWSISEFEAETWEIVQF